MSTHIRRWMPESVYSTDVETAARRYESQDQDHDLMTPDGRVATFTRTSPSQASVVVEFSDISRHFQGFTDVGGEGKPFFNLKSTLTQLGVDVTGSPSVSVDSSSWSATANVTLVATSPLGRLVLDVIEPGAYIGKLVAFPDVRRIVNTRYVTRLSEAKDMYNQPIFVVGGDSPVEPEVVGGRVIIRLPLLPGVVEYDKDISSTFSTVGKALANRTDVKPIIKLHRVISAKRTAMVTANHYLMVRTVALSMKTMFGRVAADLLPPGIRCASSNIIEPSTDMSRKSEDRTFVFVGESDETLTSIPIELFSCESFREHLPLSLRHRLPQRAEEADHLLKAFESCPDDGRPACVFVTKGGMLGKLDRDDWVVADPKKSEGHDRMSDPTQRAAQAKSYLHQQAEYPVLTAISVGDITSDGILLSRYFPSPILKSLILSREVVGRLKSIVFTHVSRSFGGFFSQDDRATLIDLCNFGVRVYHLDTATKQLAEFLRRGDTGMFVPLKRRADYSNAVFFGVYGSNLVEGDFEGELRKVLEGVLEIRKTCKHELLNPSRPLALVTGGGPGAMEVGNRVASQLGLLSVGMFVDFGSLSRKPGSNINEQKKNPYVEAYMSYRPEKLVERQSEFGLDFPIFLTGGVGTDFEYALEEVRRKVGTVPIHPMVLFGTEEHFMNKIGYRFQENKRCGTIKGSEWLSNVPYVVETGAQALEVYRRFFTGSLKIGGKAPANDKGFVVVPKDVSTWVQE